MLAVAARLSYATNIYYIYIYVYIFIYEVYSQDIHIIAAEISVAVLQVLAAHLGP